MKKKPSDRSRFRGPAICALLAAAAFAPACSAQSAGCTPAPRFAAASAANTRSLLTLPFTPFGRPETGWQIYAPLIQKEIGATCGPSTTAFAQALARWQGSHGMAPSGVLDLATFTAMKNGIQRRRPFVMQSRQECPAAPPAGALVTGSAKEGYGGKPLVLRPEALAAYRRMVAAARADSAAIRADSRNLTAFSSYRSPDYDAARCLRDGNCDGVRRATCSPHRTGYAIDLYLGQAPGYGPDSTADASRLHLSRTPTYRWLVQNAGRFDFHNYPFEPWHWEWAPPRN